MAKARGIQRPDLVNRHVRDRTDYLVEVEYGGIVTLLLLVALGLVLIFNGQAASWLVWALGA